MSQMMANTLQRVFQRSSKVTQDAGDLQLLSFSSSSSSVLLTPVRQKKKNKPEKACLSALRLHFESYKYPWACGGLARLISAVVTHWSSTDQQCGGRHSLAQASTLPGSEELQHQRLASFLESLLEWDAVPWTTPGTVKQVNILLFSVHTYKYFIFVNIFS